MSRNANGRATGFTFNATVRADAYARLIEAHDHAKTDRFTKRQRDRAYRERRDDYVDYLGRA